MHFLRSKSARVRLYDILDIERALKRDFELLPIEAKERIARHLTRSALRRYRNQERDERIQNLAQTYEAYVALGHDVARLMLRDLDRKALGTFRHFAARCAASSRSISAQAWIALSFSAAICASSAATSSVLPTMRSITFSTVLVAFCRATKSLAAALVHFRANV
jgi:hypothetical protein